MKVFLIQQYICFALLTVSSVQGNGFVSRQSQSRELNQGDDDDDDDAVSRGNGGQAGNGSNGGQAGNGRGREAFSDGRGNGGQVGTGTEGMGNAFGWENLPKKYPFMRDGFGQRYHNKQGQGEGGEVVAEEDMDWIPEWLPKCFKPQSGAGFSGLSDWSQCLQNDVSTCFDENSIQNITVCVSAALDLGSFDFLGNPPQNQNGQDFLDYIKTIHQAVESLATASRSCLHPFTGCVHRTIQERVQVLKGTCLDTTLGNLTKCARQNHETCKEPCTAALYENLYGENATMITSPFEDLQQTTIRLCSDIQEQIVLPTCELASCCEPCVDLYEDLLECVVNDILNVTAEDCQFDCPASTSNNNGRVLVVAASSVRGGRGEKQDNHDKVTNIRRLADDTTTTTTTTTTAEDMNAVIADRCLQFAPGLTGYDAQELSARAEYFINCVNYEMVDAIVVEAEKASQDDSGNTDNNDNPSTGGPSSATINMITLPMMILWVALVTSAGFF